MKAAVYYENGGPAKDLSIEEVQDHFAQAMHIEPFTIPKDALEEAGLHEVSVDRSAVYQFIA